MRAWPIFIRMHPIPYIYRRYGQPEEVAHMTLSLCLPAASFVNGAIIPVSSVAVQLNCELYGNASRIAVDPYILQL